MLRKIDNYLLSAAESLYSLLRIIVGFSFHRLRIDTANVRDCIILGNGPSLKKTLELISDRKFNNTDIYCVNFFANDDIYFKIKPTHYVLVDQSFWIENCSKDLVEKRGQLLDRLFNKTTWNMNLFLPIEAKSYFKGYDNIYINIVYFNRTPIVGFKKLCHICYDYNFGMPTPQNVLIAAIYIAIRYRYKSIYLSGADHTWHNHLYLGDDNILYLHDQHFYGEGNKLPFYKVGQREPYKMHEIFTVWAKVFRSYVLLEDYANSMNINIVNISETTFVDAFKRDSIDSVICSLK